MSENVKLNEGFDQVCVWTATSMGESSGKDFENFMLEHFEVEVQFLEEIITKPDLDVSGNEVQDTGGRIDIFFAIRNEHIPKFAVRRLPYGISWIEDVLDPQNYRHEIYPSRVKEYQN